jgi:hypothetical protein
MSPRVFGCDYRFLSCGSVFTDGLVHAAETLGVEYAHAEWSDPTLMMKVRAFAPDVFFVVNGRRFIQRWKLPFDGAVSALWLLDDPYEVDDSAKISERFEQVFVNDPATLSRHRHSTYLPACYVPRVHYTSEPGRLADQGLLTYVIGGPWLTHEVQALCKSRNVPAAETAGWYRATRIVVNVFRSEHHYNRDKIAATSLNPRVYEALACGALVVSEWRPEVDGLIPELPTFKTPEECVALVRDLLAHPEHSETIRTQCLARIQGHTYAERLQTVLAAVGCEIAA